MVRTARPKAVLELAEDEREQLLRWPRRAKSAQSLALRSKIVLVCADGLNNTQLVARLGNVPTTVGKCVGVSWTGVRTARWTSRVRGPAHDQRSDRGGDGGDAGAHSQRCDALVAGVDGRRERLVAGLGRARAVIVGCGRLALMLIVESVELLNEADDDALTIAFSGCTGPIRVVRPRSDAQSQGRQLPRRNVIDERERDAIGRAPAPWIS
jgi:hypothetical protein